MFQTQYTMEWKMMQQDATEAVCYACSLGRAALLSMVLLAVSLRQGSLGAVMAALTQGRLIPEAALGGSS